MHIDICDPSEVRSLGHNKDFLTFIDDLIRKTWICLLKEKSEAFNKFK